MAYYAHIPLTGVDATHTFGVEVKYRKTVLAIAAIAAILALAGCAPQASQIGALVPVPPISSFITGFLQAAFILWVMIWNLISFLIPLGRSDMYQDGAGLWYDVGFFIGLLVALGAGLLSYHGERTLRRRRR